MHFCRTSLCAALLLAVTSPAFARPGPAPQPFEGQYNGYSNRGGNFHRGLRDGGRGGSYYDRRHEHDGYNQRNDGYYRYGDRRRQGGIGPGKGALIGGASGAVLGGVLGGGLKGSLIGGAAGAGIGAVLGQANQDHRRRY